MSFPKEMICAGSVNGTGHPDGSKDACSVRTKNPGGFGTTLRDLGSKKDYGNIFHAVYGQNSRISRIKRAAPGS